jgi:hypothetical protein
VKDAYRYYVLVSVRTMASFLLVRRLVRAG